MIHTDGKPTIANDPRSRLLAPRIGAGQPPKRSTKIDEVIAEAEKITKEAASK